MQWVSELMGPCCDCHPVGRAPRMGPALRTLRTPGHEVELAVSPLCGLGGFAGYHTSVLVAGEEYYFGPSGVCCSPKLSSHEDSAKVRRMFVGLSQQSGTDLLDFLTEYFKAGTYDLLWKNCNSFTDCALYFLCEQRLDASFRVTERFAGAADARVGIVQRVSMGDYIPNPEASGFDLEAVIRQIAQEREGWSDSSGWEDEAVTNLAVSGDAVEPPTVAITSGSGDSPPPLPRSPKGGRPLGGTDGTSPSTEGATGRPGKGEQPSPPRKGSGGGDAKHACDALSSAPSPCRGDAGPPSIRASLANAGVSTGRSRESSSQSSKPGLDRDT